MPRPSGRSRRSTQPTCTATMPAAKRSELRRWGGSVAAARSHWVTMARRMTTYPTVITAKSLPSMASGTPAARIRAPAIWTRVVSR